MQVNPRNDNLVKQYSISSRNTAIPINNNVSFKAKSSDGVEASCTMPSVIGISGGALTYYLLRHRLFRYVNGKVANLSLDIDKSVTPAENRQLEVAIKESLRTTKLGKKGLKLVTELPEIVMPKWELFKDGKFKGMKKIFETYVNRKFAEGYIELFKGENAAFAPFDVVQMAEDMLKDPSKAKERRRSVSYVNRWDAVDMIPRIYGFDEPDYREPYSFRKLARHEFEFDKRTAFSDMKKCSSRIMELLDSDFQQIVVPDKMRLAAFHEMGHAMNYNFNKFGHFFFKLACCSKYLALILLGIALITNKKEAKSGEDLGVINKTTNFVRDNVGKLAFLAMVPLLAEEAMATIKGNKIAKDWLPIGTANKVVKSNKLAWLTYLSGAMGTGIAAFTAVKVKDYFQTKKDAKCA